MSTGLRLGESFQWEAEADAVGHPLQIHLPLFPSPSNRTFHFPFCSDIYPLVALCFRGGSQATTPGSNQAWFRLLTVTTAVANDWFGCGTFFLAVGQEKSLPMYIESYWKKQHLEKNLTSQYLHVKPEWWQHPGDQMRHELADPAPALPPDFSSEMRSAILSQ